MKKHVKVLILFKARGWLSIANEVAGKRLGVDKSYNGDMIFIDEEITCIQLSFGACLQRLAGYSCG